MALPCPWQTWVLPTPSNQLYLPWLRDQGSLTLRIRNRAGCFAVRPLYQGFGQLRHEEASCLKLPPGTPARLRQVLLVADSRAVVFAHTVMPLHPYPRHPFDLRFAQLGPRSLGSLLFSDPHIQRGPLEFCQLKPGHSLYPQALPHAAAPYPTPEPAFWGRRSCFSVTGRVILVAEFFLPNILTLC